MRVTSRLAIAAAPLLASLVAWHGSGAIAKALGCIALDKRPSPCIAFGNDVQPILSMLAWWGMLLWIPALIVSGLLVARVLVPLLNPPFGTKDSSKPNA